MFVHKFEFWRKILNFFLRSPSETPFLLLNENYRIKILVININQPRIHSWKNIYEESQSRFIQLGFEVYCSTIAWNGTDFMFAFHEEINFDVDEFWVWKDTNFIPDFRVSLQNLWSTCESILDVHENHCGNKRKNFIECCGISS